MDIKNYKKLFKIRAFEQKLLSLFNEGIISGTTHTCIGQEINALGVCQSIKKDDIVISNHRCHGHYLAHTDDYEGLMNEILGNSHGICSGIGGSQHLHKKGSFFSSGILGGTFALATGLSLGIKKKDSSKKIILFCGEGAFNEGISYEALNFISLKKLPVLIIIEKNNISQSTLTSTQFSSSIFDRIQSFNINTSYLDDYNFKSIKNETSKIYKELDRSPQAIVIESLRLSSHSKGDDTRSKDYLDKINLQDPLLNFEIKNDMHEIETIKKEIINEIDLLSKNCQKNKKIFILNNNIYQDKLEIINDNLNYKNFNFYSEHISKSLNNYLNRFNDVLLYGEDIEDDYGGAFKITRKLKNDYPDKVFNMPISESLIVGMSYGLSYFHITPIAEIMFSDFTALAFDQILNHVSKYDSMYNISSNTPIIIRTANGGGKGYGPTHSQNMERYFTDIDNINVFSTNIYMNYEKLLFGIHKSKEISLIFENKKDYSFNSKKYLTYDFLNKETKIINNNQINSFFISKSECDYQIITYGAQLKNSLDISRELFIESEIILNVTSFTKINNHSQKELELIFNTSCNNLIFIEEIPSKNSIFSKMLVNYNYGNFMKNRNIIFFGSNNGVIPSGAQNEKNHQINFEKIKKYIKDELNV